MSALAEAAVTNTASQNDDVAIVRGGLILIIAKLTHIFAGFGLYFFLLMVFTDSLGEVAGTAAFGAFGITLSVINPINMMFAIGSVQLVSQLVASRGKDFATIFMQCVRAQFILVMAFFILIEAAAPWIAEFILKDTSYTTYIRIGALIPVFYTIRCLYQGYLNGVQRFRDQSLLDIGSSLSRMVLVLGGAALGFGVFGALSGFVLSAALMLLIAYLWIRPEKSANETKLRPWEVYSFQVKIMLVTLATYYLTSLDLFAVKALSSADPLVADRMAGYFTACQKLAQIPMGLVVALAYALFPYIAKEAKEVDTVKGARIIRAGMRVVLLLLTPCCAILMSTAHPTLMLLFPSLGRSMQTAGDSIAVVSDPLFWLAFGYAIYSLLIISTMLITAAGKPGRSLLIMVISLVSGWFLTRYFVQSMGSPGAAIGLMLAWILGLVMAVYSLIERYGTFISILSLARICGCGIVVYFLSMQFPVSGIKLIVKDVALFGAFYGLVFLSMELKFNEIKQLFAILLPGRLSRA